MQRKSNYMIDLLDKIETVIREKLSDGYEISRFQYDSEDCSPKTPENPHPNAGPGISCVLTDANRGIHDLFYPIKDYPTLQSFCEGLVADAVYLKIEEEAPDLNLAGLDLPANNVVMFNSRKTGYIELPILDKCYDNERGIFDVQAFKAARDEVLPSKNLSKQRAPMLFKPASDAPQSTDDAVDNRKLTSPIVINRADLGIVVAILDPAYLTASDMAYLEASPQVRNN